MDKIMKKVFYIIFTLIIVFLISGLIPMNNGKDNCIEISGIIKSVSEGGVKDLVFELENDEIKYYINRGFENGFEISKAKKDFEGKKITLFYVNSWTLLAPFGTTSKHVAYAIVNDSVIYTEW
jgi:hypothetical protein